MKDKERDIFDDLCRSKLQDFEADTMPGDWEAIADRLTVKKSVPFRRTLRYWVAAAVISLGGKKDVSVSFINSYNTKKPFKVRGYKNSVR